MMCIPGNVSRDRAQVQVTPTERSAGEAGSGDDGGGGGRRKTLKRVIHGQQVEEHESGGRLH